jgi:hypothetical protein
LLEVARVGSMSKVNFAITARKKELGCESSGG